MCYYQITQNDLTNKVAVVTGGNSGIGFGIAEALQHEGAVGAFYYLIPLYMIASFLGLTREPLSRVRKQAVERSPATS